MVEVDMRQYDRIQGSRIKGQVVRVPEPQRFVTLKQAAIDKDLTAGSGKKVFLARDSSGSAEKLDLHSNSLLYSTTACPR
jgi:hypothetical protein